MIEIRWTRKKKGRVLQYRYLMTPELWCDWIDVPDVEGDPITDLPPYPESGD